MNVRILGRSSDANAADISVAGIDLGNGTCALVTAVVTRTKTTVAIQPGSVQLLAVNEGRLAAIIRNDGNTNLHVIEPANAYTGQVSTGDHIVGPGQAYDTTEAQFAAIYGWWEQPAGITLTGFASVTELT